MHVDSSGYGWGAILNETTEARGFLSTCAAPRGQHVAGVVRILANLPFRSPPLIFELRKLWLILRDTKDISIRSRYIKTTANILVDRLLGREIDYDDKAFNLRHFNHLDNIWGRHTIGRFAN
eukprot:jgi/Tetstr1/438642/TSEL_027193.t1